MAIASLFEDLLDQYRIEEHLAEKRYTDLYRAYDVDDDRPVRLDIVRPGVADDSGFIGRFVHRARAVAQIRHPNIALLHHIGKTPDGRSYVAQAYIDGLPLAHRLEQLAQRAQPVNTAYALKLVRQLADALVLAERLELFHYDLQPDNVWLKNVALPTDDALVLLDLFVPAERDRVRLTEGAEDRLAYLSPEQRAGKDVTAAGHVYSLGVLLYRLLAGRLPDGPVTPLDAGLRRLTGQAMPLEQERPGLHPATYELVNRCLRREPGRRFESVEVFLVALNGVLAAEEANMAAGSRVAPARRSLTWLLPILLLALILTAGFVATRTRRLQAAINPTAVVAPTATGIVALVTMPTTTHDAPGEATAGAATAAPTDAVVATATLEPAATATPPPTATAPPANTVAPSPEPTQVPVVHVALNMVNLRYGPGLNFPLLGSVRSADPLQVLAWNNDAENPWFLVATIDQQVGWISGQLLRPQDQAALGDVPVAATLPATPFPTTTPFPTPTRTPAIVIVTLTPESPALGTPDDEEPQPTEAPTEPPPPEPSLTPPPLG